MKKLFVDIDIILDIALARESHLKPAEQVLSLIELGKCKGYISAVSFATIYYLLKKGSDRATAIKYIKNLLKLLCVIEVNEKSIQRALQLEINDFEDAVQTACAESCKAEYIITRNISDYKKSPIKAITPAEYIARLTLN